LYGIKLFRMAAAHPSIHAVLTGDIVNSTQLAPVMEIMLQERIIRAFYTYKTEFYRGDSFQTYMKDPTGALRAALLVRSVTISLTATEDELVLSDIRVSVGIGPVITPVRAPGTAKGAAFLLSGRGLDEIQKTEQRLLIVSDHPMANIGFEVMADYLDVIYRGMTTKQAAAIALLLGGDTQQDVATKLGKSKSTISQLVTAGRWPEIEKILKQFENLIKQLT
jgi:Helix-turn-helix